jgi:adenylosuccinate synthase
VLLSVAYGTYPYVTSSDCSLSGLAEGVGLRTEHVDYTLGVVKGPYMTRVGKGPFPTELGGEFSDRWCGAPNATKLHEQEQYPNASVNTSDAFEQGVAIRRLGDEYGATTGRLRRVGWLDLPLLSYASRYGRKQCGSERSSIALTKVDVLNTCKTIKLCTGYRYEGVAYRSGETTFDPGSELRVAEVDSHVLEHCVPIYSEFPGWCSSLKGMKNANDLPPELLAIINEIERSANVRVDVLSIGADRDETIVL